MKRKIILSIFTAALALGITACGGAGAGSTDEQSKEGAFETDSVTEDESGENEAADKQGSEEASDSTADEESAWNDSDDTEGTDDGAVDETESDDVKPSAGQIVTMGDDDASIRVGMVTDNAGINDMSFNQSAWTGLLNINDSMGVRVSYIESASDDDLSRDLERISDDGNDISWGIGYKFADAVIEMAQKHPDRNYAIIDYSYDKVPSNVTCAVFRSQEPAFLVGYIAGNCTRTGKVGFIGGVDTSVITPFRYGFEAGLKAADEKLGKTTKLETAFLDSFSDHERGRVQALKMYDDGCDIIFQAAGGAGIGVIEAAKETGKYVIGVDTDQSYLAPANVLTSAIKKVDVAISNITVQYSMQDNIGGQVIQYGLSEHATGIPENHANFSDELYNEVMDLQRQIIAYQLDVPDGVSDQE